MKPNTLAPCESATRVKGGWAVYKLVQANSLTELVGQPVITGLLVRKLKVAPKPELSLRIQ